MLATRRGDGRDAGEPRPSRSKRSCRRVVVSRRWSWDKGYHSNQTLVGLADLGLRRYVSEPDRGRRCWQGKPVARDGAFGVPGGRRLLRQRGERLERPNAYLYETGGLRQVYMRGHTNILKHLLVHACGFNLGFLMRQQTGVGTLAEPQGRVCALVAAHWLLVWH